MRHRVRSFCLVFGFGVVTAGCGPSIPSRASSLFEGDDESWVIAGNGDSTRPQFKATGGNQNGNLCATDLAPGDVFYFVAPAKYLGTVSDVYGKRITFDVKTSSQFNLLKGRDVVLNGGGLGLVQNIRAVPGQDWTPYAFRLDDQSSWLVEDSNSRGEPATAETVLTTSTGRTTRRASTTCTSARRERARVHEVWCVLRRSRHCGARQTTGSRVPAPGSRCVVHGVRAAAEGVP